MRQVASTASFALPAASQVVPTFWPPPAQVRACHLLLESPVPARASRPRRGWFTCHEMGHTCGPGRRETTTLPPGVQVESLHKPYKRPCLPPFSRPLSRCSPLLDRPPVLGLWCADETSSAQGTIGVPSLHLLTRHREEASKERSMGLCAPRASISSLAARTSSCLGHRNRTCTVTFLAVHAASEHEEEGDGSFQARHRRRLPRCEAVPSAPSHAAPRSASRKWEDRTPDALVLDAGA